MPPPSFLIVPFPFSLSLSLVSKFQTRGIPFDRNTVPGNNSYLAIQITSGWCTRTSLLFSRSNHGEKPPFLLLLLLLGRCIGLLNGPYKVYERSTTEARWKNFFEDAPLPSSSPFTPFLREASAVQKSAIVFASPLIHDRRKGNYRGRAGEIEQEFRVRTSPGRAIYSGWGRSANWEREHVRQPLRARVCGVCARVCVCLYARWLL